MDSLITSVKSTLTNLTTNNNNQEDSPSVTSSDDNNNANTPTSPTSPIPESNSSIPPVLENNTSSTAKTNYNAVLLAWLIVLLRTREGNVSFEWRHQNETATRTLFMDATIPSLESTVSECLTRLDQGYNNILEFGEEDGLVVSTSSLGEDSEEAKDEGILHLSLSLPSTPDSHVHITPTWHTSNLLPEAISRYTSTLRTILSQLTTSPTSTMSSFLTPTKDDLNEFWSLNAVVPKTYNHPIFTTITEQSALYGSKDAIDAWDGKLTYSQIESYSNTLARNLVRMGVQLHDIIPVCFEKSRWTIVAVLGVMKAGGTLAMMDPALPVARLQGMAVQVGAKFVVSSRLQYSHASEICPSTLAEDRILVVEEAAFAAELSEDATELPEVPGSALMYIIFTSGSTGLPKGVKISHSTYTSSAFPRAAAVGYTPASRVLDFASYAFDVSIDSMLLTLSHGGCLCIPSDADRLNDINSVIRNMRINYCGLTPSVARILDTDVIQGLEALGLGGEASSARDVNAWGKETRIVIGYGPCECTIGCTINSSAATGRDYIHIGQGNGACIWIIDPSDHDRLVPFGAVGEILIEGPIVGQGYLNDDAKTKEVFIEDPAWLVKGHAGFEGRRGRCYKSGDLGRWDPDGLGGVVFVGRKDTQVKLRGQRVELGEIESQLKARLPAEATVIVDIITPAGKGAQPTLVAFIACQASGGHGRAFDIESAVPTEEVKEALQTMDIELGKVLPRYMVPNAYIPVNGIPVLISGKSDRKQLRAFGTKIDLRKLEHDAETAVPARDLNDVEIRLRRAWSVVLKCEEDSIRLEDNFFALGGESLTAMKLVSVCRADGLELSVIGTFGNPTLMAMAAVVEICDNQEKAEIPSFSMIAQAAENARLEASQICGVEVEKVQDIYPCTPTQESLFTFSLKSVKPYVAQRVACIPSHINIEAWKKAWETVVDASPILSTRLAQLQEPGLMQVVLNESITWTYPTNLEEYLINDKKDRMDLGERLARYAIIENATDGKTYMVWTVHHVLYDGWSEPIILQQVNDVLHEQKIETQVQMRDFVKYVRDTDETAMQAFWRQELKGADGPQFPRLPTRDYMPTPDAMLEHYIPLETCAGSQFTLATLIRGAWSLVASQYTGSDDVVFGETLIGRDISLAGVENIVGPLIATVPIRVRIDRKASVESYLQTVQRGMLARTPYQHMGMQNIRKVSTDAQYACETGTGLVIQPESDHIASELGFHIGDPAREALYFNPYPLMLACGIGRGGFRICASFDSSLIETAQMERMLAQLETACVQLTQGLDRRSEEVSCLPAAQLNDIWSWNQIPPLTLDKSTNMVRASASTKQGSLYPRAVIPWVCDIRNPALLSPIGCVGELWLESALLSNETATSPAWLLAGSSSCAGRIGAVRATGDMVQLQADGSLTFVGRRENVMPVQGHAVDITLLESHFAKTLPLTNRAAVAMLNCSDESQQELIVFVEQEISDEDSVEILPAKFTIDNFETQICTSISTPLVIALRKLDKSLCDNLPSYMIPSTYVVVETLSPKEEQLDQNELNRLASGIPQDSLLQLRSGLKQAWAQTPDGISLTPSEIILRSAWAKILGMEAKEIDLEDNFFRLGGDSVLAMKLVSNLRVQGHGLTVADIFQNMRLVAAAKVLKVSQVSSETKKSYKAFSTLGAVEAETFVSEIVRTKLADLSWTIQDVLPVTDSQALDIKATIQKPRTSIQYTLMYFNQDIEGEKLASVCNELVKTHDILRTVFIEHESKFFQVVLDKLAAPIVRHHTEEDLKQYVNNLCSAGIEIDFQLGTSFLRLYHVQGIDGQSCLVLGLSHAQYDGVSLPMLLRDLEMLYTGGKIVDSEPFSSYIAQTHDEKTQSKAMVYWRDTLSGSLLSVIEGTGQPTDKSIFHTKEVDIAQRPEEITTANLLTAAWALVLARRLQKPDVTFGSVTSGRTLDMTNAENIQGPCYQITPIRVAFQQQWTAMDLLRFVQKQSAESAAFDFLGFEKISKQCTQWAVESETRFFDSIVHHQDFEDFDTMPFAGGECRVDILNPHGDAAHPVKAVSFVRDGKAFVGMVGSENAAASVDKNLEELAAAIQELATVGSERKLLEDGLF